MLMVHQRLSNSQNAGLSQRKNSCLDGDWGSGAVSLQENSTPSGWEKIQTVCCCVVCPHRYSNVYQETFPIEWVAIRIQWLHPLSQKFTMSVWSVKVVLRQKLRRAHEVDSAARALKHKVRSHRLYGIGSRYSCSPASALVSLVYDIDDIRYRSTVGIRN